MPELADPRLNDAERKVLLDVEEYGWHCLHVSEADDPVRWTYSIGITKTWQQPEIVMFGLPSDRAHPILADFVQEIREGKFFEADQRREVFAGGYEGVFLAVDERWHAMFLGFGQWFYDYSDFPALQCVWPDSEGRLPWEPGFAVTDFPQPLLISESDALRLGYSLEATSRAVLEPPE